MSSAIRSAVRSRSREAGSSSPRRGPRKRLGTVKRVSQLTTQSRVSPCSTPTGTSVGSPRTVPVTAATVTLASTGIARSRVTTTMGRRPPSDSSTSRISPRFTGVRPLRPGRRPRAQPARPLLPTPLADVRRTLADRQRRSRVAALPSKAVPVRPAMLRSCLRNDPRPRPRPAQPRRFLAYVLEPEWSYRRYTKRVEWVRSSGIDNDTQPVLGRRDPRLVGAARSLRTVAVRVADRHEDARRA